MAITHTHTHTPRVINYSLNPPNKPYFKSPLMDRSVKISEAAIISEARLVGSKSCKEINKIFREVCSRSWTIGYRWRSGCFTRQEKFAETNEASSSCLPSKEWQYQALSALPNLFWRTLFNSIGISEGIHLGSECRSLILKSFYCIVLLSCWCKIECVCV